MKKDVTFGPIKEKMKDIVVEGQGCLNDCKKYKWLGNQIFKRRTCRFIMICSAFWSPKH